MSNSDEPYIEGRRTRIRNDLPTLPATSGSGVPSPSDPGSRGTGPVHRLWRVCACMSEWGAHNRLERERLVPAQGYGECLHRMWRLSGRLPVLFRPDRRRRYSRRGRTGERIVRNPPAHVRHEHRTLSFVARGIRQCISGSLEARAAPRRGRCRGCLKIARSMPCSRSLRCTTLQGTHFDYVACKSPQEVRASARTRYYPSKLDQVIEFVRNNEGRYAMVALPCAIKALQVGGATPSGLARDESSSS